MKRVNASRRLSSGFLTATLLAIPAEATAATFVPQLEADIPVQTVIEEWHWRNMTF
ncbi:MAG: hypothetical protein AAF243_05665 [Cyanobacteria bacterium P01_A01_bin.137]